MKVRKNNRKRRSSGFSLLELLAVVTILGIIAVVVIPRISVSAGTAKANAAAQSQAEINSAIERYYFDTGSFPTDLATLFGSATYFPDGAPKNPYTGVAAATEWTFNGTTNRCTGYKTQ
jgi:prepilin-type N-terminal cleavage/methylation domain-containing protein